MNIVSWRDQTLADKILRLLESIPFGLSRRELWARYMGSYTKETFYNTLSILKKKGIIVTGEDATRLTDAGRKYWQKRAQKHPLFSLPKNNIPAGKNLILYDIPEPRKGDREWLRFQLQKFGYKMVQRSVWVGPDQIPKEFWKYVKLINLSEYIKFYRLKS